MKNIFLLLILLQSCHNSKNIVTSDPEVRYIPIESPISKSQLKDAITILESLKELSDSDDQEFEEIEKEIKNLNFEPFYANCKILDSSFLHIKNKHNKIKAKINTFDDKLKNVIEVLFQLHLDIEKTNKINRYKIANDSDYNTQLDISKKTNDTTLYYNDLFNKGLEVLKNIKIDLNNTVSLVKILRSNINFYKLQFIQYKVYFKPGYWNQDNMTISDSLTLDNYLEDIKTSFNNYKKLNLFKNMNLKIVIIASGHTDEIPPSKEVINRFESRDNINCQQIQEKLNRDVEANRIISNYRARTLANYIQYLLNKKNIKHTELCSHGYGQTPFKGIRNPINRDNQERRVANFFCQIIALD